MSRLETRIDTIASQLSMVLPNQPEINSNLKSHGASTGARSSVVHIHTALRQACARYCRCQCHRMTTVRMPPWIRSLSGSLVLQYSGAVAFRANACDVVACHSNGRRLASIGCTFPAWLFIRAISVSVAWSSLTNAGASLHLMMPTQMRPNLSIWRAMHSHDLAWLSNKIENKELLPTNIDGSGDGVLQVSG
jgi:hypothetical protein